MQLQSNLNVNKLVDYLYGREAQSDDTGAVARWVRSMCPMRPALGDQSRWPDIAAMKSSAAIAGPNITSAQIDTACAAAGVPTTG